MEETEQEPGLTASYPIGLSSTIDPAAADLGFSALACDLAAVVLAFLLAYLGAQAGRRNAAAVTPSAT